MLRSGIIKDEMPSKIEISHRTIVFTVLFLLLLWFLYQIRQILVILFVGIILTAALNPLVERLEKWRIPRILGAILIYFLILVFFGSILAGLIPPLISQTNTLVSRLPDYLESSGLLGIDRNIIDSQIDQLLSLLGSISLDIVKITISVFGNFITFFILFFVSFYLLLEHKNLNSYLIKLFGPKGNEKANRIIGKIEHRLGVWAGAQITLMIIVGVMSYIGLRLLGIDYALPLALLAGLLEVVPNVGPVIASIPAILAGLAVSPLMGLAVAALYFLVQQLENHIIVPQVMAKGVGLNPLITILGLIAGFKIGGVLGAVLSLPSVILIEILLGEVFASDKFKKA